MIRFGTDGVRGPAGVFPIDAAGARRVGAAAARLAEGGPVLIARDTRPSGVGLVAALAEGVAGASGEVWDLGVLPGSGCGALVAATPGAVGVIVTASHNPAVDNGFKLLAPGGKKPDDEVVAQLEAWMADDAPAAEPAVRQVASQARSAWLAGMRDALPGIADTLAGRRIGVDVAAGAATAVLNELRTLLPRTEITVVGAAGPINEGVGSEHPQALAERVREDGLDAGIAVDGDADRCVLLDARGEVVHGDALAWLLAGSMGAGGVAVTVMSTYALEPALPGVEVVRTPVGDRHLALAMAEHGLALGCEASGHALFSDAFPVGDGLLTGLRALEAIFGSGDSVESAVAAFTPWPQRLGKLQVAQRPDLAEVDAIQQAVEAAEARISPGRVLLRYSGTEPVLRIFVEGPDASAVASAYAALASACAEALG